MLVTCWNPEILRQIKSTESQDVIRKEKCFPTISQVLKRYLFLLLVPLPFEMEDDEISVFKRM